ncbi:MAG: C1 family peptidase [Syntrophobacteraceae bacterium]
MLTRFFGKSRSGLFPVLACFCLLLFCSGALADTVELARVRQAIQENNAQWEAGETTVSRLPEAGRRGLLGVNKAEMRKLHATAPVLAPPTASAVTALAPSLDWTDYDFVTPVKDQANCGSCWAFATTATLESQVAMTTSMLVNLSEQVLNSCSGAGNCGGGYVDRASSFIRDTGLPIEECFPYTAKNTLCSGAACADWETDTYRVTSWHWVATTSPTVNSLKTALNTYGPLVTTFDVYEDFYSYQSGIYSYVYGGYEGGHAVQLVGYDDAAQCFIVKNSWGTGWGEDGFFRIAYSQLDTKVYFGEFTIAYDGLKDPPVQCAYAVSPTAKTFAAAGGNGTLSVTAASGCSWSAVSNVSWIHVTSGASGSGNGSVGYHVDANTSAKRTGTITVAGKTFTVTQNAPAAASCPSTISPTGDAFTASGGTDTISVTTASGCTWSAVSNVSWLHVTSGASGSGKGTVSYSVAANTSGARSGTMTVAGKTFRVAQSAAGTSCTYSISPSGDSFGASGGSGTLSVTTTSGCAWSALSNASWIKIVSGAIGTKSGSVSYSVGSNTTGASRSGTISVGGKTFTVTQNR